MFERLLRPGRVSSRDTLLDVCFLAGFALLLMATGLTFGSISALFGLTHGYVDQAQYSILVTGVIASAVIPTPSVRQRLNSTVHPSMSIGLNQNAPNVSSRSALWCIWWNARHRRSLLCIERCQA